MKLIFTTMLVIVLFSACSTTIFVVRHAEKQTAGSGSMMTSDPDLTDDGRLRAKALAGTLTGKKITAVYATQYKRTQQTAEPTATIKITTVRPYDAAAGEHLIDSLAHRKKKGYLVVGHSNTLLTMLLKLGLYPSMQEIPENDYDNLFIVRVKWLVGRSIKLTEKTFGKPSP